MWSNEELVELVDRVRYTRPGREWLVQVGFRHSEPFDPAVVPDRELVTTMPFVQVHGETAGEAWTGRKWFLSRHMTVTEIVSTCFKAIMAAEEHELREFFTYKGHAVFGPHYDVEAMIELSERGRVDVRANAMSGA